MICIYRKGNTHKIKGVECEMTTISPSNIEHYLDNGWVLNVNKLKRKKKGRPPKNEPTEG